MDAVAPSATVASYVAPSATVASYFALSDFSAVRAGVVAAVSSIRD